MKIMMIDTKLCVQLVSNDNYFSYIFYSRVKKYEEVMAEGVYYCGSVDMIHKGFCLATLEQLNKYCTVVSYLVLKSTPIVPSDRPLVAIR